MGNFRLSKEVVLGIAGLFAILIIGPNLLSSDKQSFDSKAEEYQALIDERQKKVKTSLEQLSIADDALMSCIEATANERARISPMNSGGIDNVRELENLYCPRKGIQTLAGIEQLHRLEFLDVSYNGIQDISPLAMNTALTSLRLKNNPVDDLSPLRDMVGLRDITLPTLPNTLCSEIKEYIGNIKSNINSTNCSKTSALTLQTAQKQPAKKKDKTTTKKKKDPNTLSYDEEEELLDYEYDMQRRFD